MRNCQGFAVAACLICNVLLWATQANAQDKSLNSDRQQIVSIINSFFDAAREDSAAKFNALVAPGFYMFDGGKRFDGDAIISSIKKAHANGMHFEWSVNSPDVHVIGDAAWVAYINRGSITSAAGTKDISWLESWFLERQAGVWKLVFGHSGLAAPQ